MNSILSFYKKIYEQELSQAKMMHLYSSRVLKRYFVSKTEELLNEESPYIPLGDVQGEEIIKTLELKSNEVSLKYYSFARISRFVTLNKYESTRVYPLFEYEAEVKIKDGEYYLYVDNESRQFLKNNLPPKIVGNREFKKIRHAELIDFHFASKLCEIIQKATPKADGDELMLFPNLWTDRKLKGAIKKDFEVGDQYVPIGIVAIVEKENNSFTTLDELDKIHEAGDLSAPLSVLFEGLPNYSDEKTGIICEELNASQYGAILNSNEKIVSVVSGPPGTGKSFTIANLAAEKVSKGKSILITSKNKEALDVIEEKIKGQLGIKNLCVNPSQDQNFAWMKDHLDFVLGRQYKRKNIQFSQIEVAFARFQKMHDNHLEKEEKLMQQFRLERDYTASLDKGLSKRTTTAFRNRIFTYRGKSTIPLWESLDDHYKRIEKIREKAISSLHLVNSYMLEEGINQYRHDLREYLSFLRARARERKEKLSKKINYDAVLKAFPVWLVRANDVSRVLPLKKEAFDILIIDEASQCDIPSIIPLIQRAKKVVIVGDVKQLTHLSFISKAFERASKSEVPDNLKHLCQHRDRSILHLVQDHLDPQDRIQLNEHFRSQFPIIAFSNTEFYNERLDILTKRPISVAEHVQFVKTAGIREKGANPLEAKVLLDKIQSIITEEKDLPNALKTSIGILSPFRKQVDYLFEQLAETFKINEIKAHKIIVGTAFTFQGNERDVMLLSLSLDNEALGGSFTFLNRKDVFNVSITRARNVQYIYHSFDPSQLKSDSTIANFFRFYDKNLEDDLGRSTHDEFCIEVAEVLKEQGLKTWTNFNVSGVSIDLLTQVEDQFIGIDLIGFEGEMEDFYSLERYKMIERGNIKLFPLPYPLWMGDRALCLEAIKHLTAPPVEEIEEILEEKEIIEPEVKKIEKVAKPKEKKAKRKYVRFSMDKIEAKRYSHPDSDWFSVQLKIGNTKYAELWVSPLDKENNKILSIGYNVVKRHEYKGLEALLLFELDVWLNEHPFYSEVNVNIYNPTEKDLVIFEANGFEQSSRRLIQPEDRTPYEQLRMHKTLTFKPGKVITKLMGKKVYLRTREHTGNTLISFEIYLKETLVGILSVKSIGKGEACVHFKMDTYFYNLGLGETLMKELHLWSSKNTDLERLIVFIFKSNKEEYILFQNYGFAIAKQTIKDSSKATRLVKQLK
jgi:superfamily I DNA and/or RNA helicase